MNKLALLAVAAVLLAPIAGVAAATDLGGSDRSSGLATERAPGTADTLDAREDPSTAESAVAPSPPDLAGTQQFDRSKFVVTVYPNGTALWTFQYFQQLSQNETERQQFRDFADRFETEETELYTSFVDRATALAATGRNLTGRNMTASGFDREAYVEEGINYVGVVEMSFRWSAFAERRGDAVVVADVFEGGFYIGSTQTLVVEPGGDLAFGSVAPEGTLSGTDLRSSDSVTWQGEREFSDQRPRVVLRPAESLTTTTTTAGAGPGGNGGDGGDGADGGETTRSLPWMIVLGLIAVLAGGGALAAYRRNSDGAGSPPVTTASSDGGGGAAAADSPASGGDAQPAAAPEPAVPDEELLTDEDRVVNLLEENGGRMKQVNIVDETGWSKSKVSMLLSDMEEEETISKLRVGRENIISLQGHEPDAAGSPFEEK